MSLRAKIYSEDALITPKRNRGIPREYLVYKNALAKEIGDRIRNRRIEMGLAQQALRERYNFAASTLPVLNTAE
jgi:hypothetical protein